MMSLFYPFLFPMLSVFSSNCQHDVKWRGSRKCHTEMAMCDNRWWWIYFIKYKLLSLSPTDCHNTWYFDRKLASTQFEESGRIWRTQLNPRYKDILSRSSNFRVMQGSWKPLKTMCCHRKPRDVNIFYVLPTGFGRGSTVNFNLICCVGNSVFLESKWQKQLTLISLPNHKLSKKVYLEKLYSLVQHITKSPEHVTLLIYNYNFLELHTETSINNL
jgi:hypothetical protein